MLSPENQKILNARGMALFSEICDWEAQNYLPSGLFCNVCGVGGEEGSLWRILIWETCIKEIQTLEQVAQKGCEVSISIYI